jgi:hypothetical protein
MDQKTVNKALLKLWKRAESTDRAKLVDTFVDVGPLFTLLSNHDHQILFGRRGTGKTHALLYLAETVRSDGDLPIYLDMRITGSTGGIYSDTSVPLKERATRLLTDTLSAIHDSIYEYAIDHDDDVDLSNIGPALDELARAITEVEVVGSFERETVEDASAQQSSGGSTSLSVGTSGVDVSVDQQDSSESSISRRERVAESGQRRLRVHFGRVGNSLRTLLDELPHSRIWLILDEWSVVPIDLQPLLADLLRRSVFPIKGYTVKIGAVEQRTNVYEPGSQGDYVGIEPGADASADLNLDDFMVFDNDAARATEFFRELLFRHFRSVDDIDLDDAPTNSRQLVQLAFTQVNTFEEFVRASEGVPRDAINILAIAAQRDLNSNISMDRIRAAASTWYQRQKEDAVSSNPEALRLLHWISDEVIGERRARAFLLRSNKRHRLIDALFDARVIHLLKKNISAHDQPGVRYDVYKLDYGCYVNLMATQKAPEGLLPFDDGESKPTYVEVPPDDYRAIRRAILDLEGFEAATA